MERKAYRKKRNKNLPEVVDLTHEAQVSKKNKTSTSAHPARAQDELAKAKAVELAKVSQGSVKSSNANQSQNIAINSIQPVQKTSFNKGGGVGVEKAATKIQAVFKGFLARKAAAAAKAKADMEKQRAEKLKAILEKQKAREDTKAKAAFDKLKKKDEAVQVTGSAPGGGPPPGGGSQPLTLNIENNDKKFTTTDLYVMLAILLFALTIMFAVAGPYFGIATKVANIAIPLTTTLCGVCGGLCAYKAGDEYSSKRSAKNLEAQERFIREQSRKTEDFYKGRVSVEEVQGPISSMSQGGAKGGKSNEGMGKDDSIMVIGSSDKKDNMETILKKNEDIDFDSASVRNESSVDAASIPKIQSEQGVGNSA